MMAYRENLPAFKHQKQHFAKRRDTPAWGLLWEQGVGKTKAALDNIGYLYLEGKIDGVVIVAPNMVHRNWINDELPKHLAVPARALYYESGKAQTKWHKRECEELLKHKGLAILAISYDGFMTKTGKLFMRRFLKKRRVFYVVDESHYIKAPKAKRTISIVASGKYAPYRRILTGTPIEKPFDIYTQIKFLEPTFWLQYGLGSAAAFRQFFGVWRTRAEVLAASGYDPGYDELVEYRNLDLLKKWVGTLTDRVLKSEVFDLPPKLYTKLYFEMTPLQRGLYNGLREQYILELEDDTIIDADMAIVRMLRLQQITCGYVQTEAKEPIRLISKLPNAGKYDKKNPRLESSVEYLEELTHPAIIWARFRHDVDQLMERLGNKAVRFDGTVSNDECELAKNRFMGGDVQFFVGNTAKGKEGLTLTAARTVMYYSNYFALLTRLQSEDRAHRHGTEHPVNYVDVVTEDSVDMHIVKALQEKFEVASQVTGDQLKEWL